MEDTIEDFVRVTKSSVGKEPLLKISNEVLMTIQRKRECETRALRIIEFLIDGKLQPEPFLQCLKYISQEQYQDVVEERAIVKLCGYSLCGRKLPDMPKQKYIISRKANKIYEITDRKNYCSNFCYKASLHVKGQIDTSPLWLRNSESSTFSLLPASEIGIPGEEIDQGIAKPTVDSPAFTSVLHFTEACLGQDDFDATHKKTPAKKNRYNCRLSNPAMNTIAENEEEECDGEYYDAASVRQFDDDDEEVRYERKSVRNIKKLKTALRGNKIGVIVEEAEIGVEFETANKCDTKQPSKEKKKEVSNAEKLANLRNKLQANKERQIKLIDARVINTSNVSDLKVSNSIEEVVGSRLKKGSISDGEKLINPKDNGETFSKIKRCVKEWLTIDTYLYIYGEKKIKLIFNEKKLLECFDKLRIGELETPQRLRCMNICKRLQLQELAEEQMDGILLGKSTQPLPDYKNLKEEGKEHDLKVKTFLSGAMYEQADSNFPTKSIRENEEVDNPAVLPFVDHASQNALRRTVFLNSIDKTIRNVIGELQLGEQSTLCDIKNLVRTFRLQAHNVIFKPIAWSLIAVVLVNMLALRDEDIRRQLQSERSLKHIRLILSKFSGTDGFMKDLFSDIADVDAFIEFYVTNNDA